MTRVINISDFKDLIKPEIIDCLLLLKSKGYLNRLIICGSLGLVLNKELKREVKDIDLLTMDDLYGVDNSLQVYGDYSEGNKSHSFNVNGQKITCWKIYLCGVKIDMLHNEKLSEYEVVDLHLGEINGDDGVNILTVKIEKPESAFLFKKQYVENDKSEDSRKKHLADLQVSGRVKVEENTTTSEVPTFPNIDDDLPF